MNVTTERFPTLYIPHGGGPCFFMDPAMWPKNLWDRMAAHLRGLPAEVGRRPKAIVVISAHWETHRPSVNANPAPPMLFDYYGFPEHTYHLSYPAPGSPALARRIGALWSQANIAHDMDEVRGFDHGVFVPMLLSYPLADIPIVEISLQQDLSAEAHLAMGRALAPLREEGVLIIGSGMSYHNMSTLRSGQGGAASQLFDAWLTNAVQDADVERRSLSLSRWQRAPHAHECHPRSEHLMPLLVAAGAAGGDRGICNYAENLATHAISGYRFG